MNASFFWLMTILIVAGTGIGASSSATAYHWTGYAARQMVSSAIVQAEQSAEAADAPVQITLSPWGTKTAMIVSPPLAPAGTGARTVVPESVTIVGTASQTLTANPNGTLTSNGSPVACPVSVRIGTQAVSISC